MRKHPQPHHGHDHDEHDEKAGHKHHEHHGHAHSHAHMEGQAPKAIIGAMIVTLIFMVVELVGGWLANSLALISDGAHMLTDVGAMLLSLFAIWIARRPYSGSMSFGYHRAEILGALASGLLIWAIAGVLVYEAFARLQAPPEVHGKIFFVVATIGLAANFLSMKMLHSSKEHNINVRAAYLHLISDALGSVGAIIAGLVIWLTGWRLIDPIVTFFFAVLMVISSWSLLKEAVAVLMESAPSWIPLDQVKKQLLTVPHVSEVHDLHVWTVSTGRLALSVHLIAKPSTNVLSAANTLLRSKYGIYHTTIQVEDPEHFDQEGCYDCDK